MMPRTRREKNSEQQAHDDALTSQSDEPHRLARDGQAQPRAEEAAVILLAEDNHDMRGLVAQALRIQGYEVMEAKDGRELLRRAASGFLLSRHRKPDLIISDLRMPGISGMEVLAGLRQSDWAIPFIIMTAFGDDATHAEARRLGAATVFDKPFDMEALIGRVRDIVPPSLG